MRKAVTRATAALLLGIAAAWTLPAQAGRGNDLTIKIAVAGPGDELYFWWGHIALIIDDARTGQSRFYDYGLFSFEQGRFFVNFAFGRLWYSSGTSSTARSIAAYVEANRDITLYTLNIPPEKKEEIRRFAEQSVLPENRDYLYHHFKHNCTGPILEIINMATDGQFEERYRNEPGRFTLRQHVRRHTWFAPFFDWVLCFLMGQDIDTPITVWEELFLPAEIGRRITEFSRTGPDGTPVSLISNVEAVYQSSGRPPVLDIPRRQWPRELAFSLCVAAILGCLFYLQARSTAHGQVLLGITHSLLGLFFGGMGLLLFFMSTFTSHDYTYHNANILFCNPLLLIAVPMGIRYASAKNYYARLRPEFILRLLWLLVALGIFISMAIKLTPWFWQQNLTDQMLMLPIALALAFEPAGLKRMIYRIFWRWL